MQQAQPEINKYNKQFTTTVFNNIDTCINNIAALKLSL